MNDLLDAITALVSTTSPEKIRAIASRLRRTDCSKAAGALDGVVGTPMTKAMLDEIIDAWRMTNVDAGELASMLLAASHAFSHAIARQTTELVWTGPKTPFVSARRTEQALLQVINAAQHGLFITSFVAYDVSTIVKALNAASERGVSVSMLLESSQEQGGSISFDVLGKMKTLVPTARLYAWRDKSEPFTEGSVHAKVAVADGEICFITSANLTGYAMERNMEAGVLINGGHVPRTLYDHLHALVQTKLILQI